MWSDQWKITYGNLRRCLWKSDSAKEPQVGCFHCWTSEPNDEPRYEKGEYIGLVSVSYPKAIIELYDGKIELVDPYSIQFINEE